MTTATHYINLTDHPNEVTLDQMAITSQVTNMLKDLLHSDRQERIARLPLAKPTDRTKGVWVDHKGNELIDPSGRMKKQNQIYKKVRSLDHRKKTLRQEYKEKVAHTRTTYSHTARTQHLSLLRYAARQSWKQIKEKVIHTLARQSFDKPFSTILNTIARLFSIKELKCYFRSVEAYRTASLANAGLHLPELPQTPSGEKIVPRRTQGFSTIYLGASHG